MPSIPPRNDSSRRARFNRQSRILIPHRPGCELLESRTLMSAGQNTRSSGLTTAIDFLPMVAGHGEQALKSESQRAFATTLKLAQGFDLFGQGVVTGPLVVLTGRTAPFALVRLDVGADGTFEQQVRAGAQGRFMFATNVGAGLTPFQVVATNRTDKQSSNETSVYRFDTSVVPGFAQRGGITTLAVAPSLDLSRHGVVNGPDIILVGHTIPRSRLILKAAGTTKTTYADAAGNYQFSLNVARGMTLVQVDATGPGGRHTRARVALFRIDTTNPPVDDQPPIVVIQSQTSGLLTKQNLSISGQVTDDASGVASLQEQVDSGPFVPVSFDASGHFSFITSLPLDGKADGVHSVNLRATDRAGNVLDTLPSDSDGDTGFLFTLDTLAPNVTTGLSGVMTSKISSIDVHYSEDVSSNAADPNSYLLRQGANAPVPIASVEKLSPSEVRLVLAAPIPNGSYQFSVGGAISDSAGNSLTGPKSFSFSVAQPVHIAEITPASGEELVSPTRLTVVRFDDAVDPATVTADSFYLIAQGARVPGTISVSSTDRFATFTYANPLPAATEVRVVVDGSKIMGRNGLALDADGDNTPGGMATADFTTLPLTRIPHTDVFGYVYDSYNKNPDGSNIPIVGATIRVDAFPQANAITDATGKFILHDMPAPEFFVHVDGSTATNAPAGTSYPSVGKPFHSVPGQSVQLFMDGKSFDIFLPPMAMSDVKTLSKTTDTPVHFGAAGMAELQKMFPTMDPSIFGRVMVDFPPNSAVDNNGKPADQAIIIPVPPDRIPAPLPSNLTPKLVISIQAPGATRFDVPAPVTFPNLDGLKPGEKALFFSFNHDAGRWDVIGTGTVSSDGLTISSDPGTGIRAPGWHLVQVGTPTAGQPCTSSDCVLVNGREGDVIKVDLSGTVALSTMPDKANFALDSFSLGTWAKEAGGSVLTDGADPFSKSGIFYFVPTVQFHADQAGPLQQPIGHFHATLYRKNPQTGAEESTTENGIIRITLSNSYSTSGENAVPTGTLDASDRLAVYQVQQRLHYFNYQDRIGATAQDLIVDGGFGAHTEHALGVFNAAAQGLDKVNESETNVMSFINAANAPLWIEYQFPSANLVDNENIHEHWMTSWMRDSLNAAKSASTSSVLFNGATTRGGGKGPSHATHQAGMNLDVGLSHTEQADCQANLNATGPLNASEQAVLDRMLVFYNNRTVGIRGIILEYPRINKAFNRATGTTLVFQLNTTVHKTHFHIIYSPPGITASEVRAQSLTATDLTSTLAEPVSTATGFGSDPRLYYRFDLPNGLSLQNRSSKAGNFSEILTPNADYTLSIYQASTNRSAVYHGHSSPSGIPTDLGPIILDTFGGPDADSDGLPDVGEYAIGTDPKKADSDSDGISDSAAIAQGLDPLGGKAFPTGVIANLPLAGPAEKVTVADDKVYIATGGHGLAVVDASKFNNPAVLGQIDLGGSPSDVGVDTNLKIAAVATGSKLVLVDVSDPMTPKVLQSVAVAADRVVVANGLAYATSVTSLRVVNLLTGQTIQGLTLPGSGTITGLARDGSKLYAFVSGSDILSVVDISKEAAAAVVGQVTVSIASSDVGVFAGNNVVWLAGSGLRTVDVSDPTKPKEIHDADSFFNSRRVVLNGSGLGLLTPDSGDFLQVYDTTDPNKTANLLTQFTLGDATRSVAISRGIGYVGTSKGLQVINYLPFDTKGKAPTVSVQTDAIDLDPNTPGIQVLEGGSIPIRVNISDDVQVRDVQLIVDGKVVSDAVAFPFNFSAVALAGTTGAKSVTIQAKATDTGGNSTLSAPVVIQLVPDTFPPTIVSIDPPDGSVRGKGTTTLRARFSEPLDPSKFKPGTFTLVEAGADGKFGTKDDVSVPIKGVEARDNNTLVQITTDPIPIGLYQIRVNAPDVTDRFNNPLGTKVVTSAFTVKNFVPVTINFNAGSGSPRSYTESGLSITSGQDHLHMGDQNGDGSPDLLNHSGCCSTPYTFTFGGQPFSVLSMDVVGGSGIGSETFTSSTGAISKPTTKGTFTFDANGWTNITSFTWDQPSGDFIIDNLVLAVVPGSGGSISSASIVAALSRSEQAARQGDVVDAAIVAMDDEGLSHTNDPGGVPVM